MRCSPTAFAHGVRDGSVQGAGAESNRLSQAEEPSWIQAARESTCPNASPPWDTVPRSQSTSCDADTQALDQPGAEDGG